MDEPWDHIPRYTSVLAPNKTFYSPFSFPLLRLRSKKDHVLGCQYA
jgi:hypothetical protein